MQTTARLTGERPQQGVTPDSLLALHAAGYQAIVDRLGPGRVLDVGCGQGFESIGLGGPDRVVVGVDYSAEATTTATARFGLPAATMDVLALGLAGGSFDAVCSSHLIEHFPDAEAHVAELAQCSLRRARPSSSPRTPRPTSRTLFTSASSAGPSSSPCSSAPSATSGWVGSMLLLG